MEQGQTEEEIAANLGSPPQAIAGYYEAHHMIGLAELESSLRNLSMLSKPYCAWEFLILY